MGRLSTQLASHRLGVTHFGFMVTQSKHEWGSARIETVLASCSQLGFFTEMLNV
jgi:hypothetical protein